ncbi:hypothetical protein [Endozoicomonas ascidiicola]|uniref:hypothetical protein n=1 Tax=Endozoicomonas ascidiicola TaxID=1698521 RepID=UPI00082C062D|nr:hypothetical protein [Endozoicomonas ascidiicola]
MTAVTNGSTPSSPVIDKCQNPAPQHVAIASAFAKEVHESSPVKAIQTLKYSADVVKKVREYYQECTSNGNVSITKESLKPELKKIMPNAPSAFWEQHPLATMTETFERVKDKTDLSYPENRKKVIAFCELASKENTITHKFVQHLHATHQPHPNEEYLENNPQPLPAKIGKARLKEFINSLSSQGIATLVSRVNFDYKRFKAENTPCYEMLTLRPTLKAYSLECTQSFRGGKESILYNLLLSTNDDCDIENFCRFLVHANTHLKPCTDYFVERLNNYLDWQKIPKIKTSEGSSQPGPDTSRISTVNIRKYLSSLTKPEIKSLAEEMNTKGVEATENAKINKPEPIRDSLNLQTKMHCYSRFQGTTNTLKDHLQSIQNATTEDQDKQVEHLHQFLSNDKDYRYQGNRYLLERAASFSLTQNKQSGFKSPTAWS